MIKDLDELKKESEQAKKLAEERLNSWKRSAADFENYKKRREKEDQELMVFIKGMVLARLLPSLEALSQSLKHIPPDEKYKEWGAGMEKTQQQLVHSLKELGVEMIKTVGEKYDHSIHEAIEMVDSSTTDKTGGQVKSGHIVEEVAVGYKINGKVVRPAKVKVAK